MEAEELLSPLDESFIELEKSPDNMELVNEIFRSMHTIKGRIRIKSAGVLWTAAAVSSGHWAAETTSSR